MNTKNKIIFTDNAPKPIGPYSQAIDTGTFVFVSGQIPLDHKSGEVVGDDIETQSKIALDNLRATLAAANLSFENIVKTTVFIKDMNNFAKFNNVYQTAMDGCAPARSVVEVSALPKGVMIEIEAIACR